MAEPCVAILGPGLLGGSVAMALRERMDETRIHVWARRTEAAKEVMAKGLADLASTNLAEVTQGASLIIIATPVQFMAEIAATTDLMQPALGCFSHRCRKCQSPGC